MENCIEEIYDALYDYFEFDGISKKTSSIALQKKPFCKVLCGSQTEICH